MIAEEFNKLFTGISSENFQEKILDIKETLGKENDTAEQAYANLKAKDEEIAKLRDTNQRLFLRVSGEVDTSEVEEAKSITLDDIINNIKEA